MAGSPAAPQDFGMPTHWTIYAAAASSIALAIAIIAMLWLT